MIRKNGGMVLNATSVDEHDARKCALVAPVVPMEVPAAVEVQDENMRSSGNLADLNTLEIVCWMEHGT